MSFWHSFATPVTILRPFNTYGPRQSARAVIPTIITQIATGERRIKLGALTPTRDFNYVSDTVSGFMAALATNRGLGEIINVGSNFEVSIEDTAKNIAYVMGADIEIQTDEQRIRPLSSEVERLCASNLKAQKLLGWTPKFAGIEGLRRGLVSTVAWFKEPENLAGYKSKIYNI